MCLQHKSFENTAGKGEIARNEQFLLFPQCFLPISKLFCCFHQTGNCRLQFGRVQNLSFGKELINVFSFYEYSVNSSPNDKISDWSKFKAFADNKLNVAENLIFVYDSEENIAGKGENAG